MTELTEGMKEALIAVIYGVRKYTDGYRAVDTHERVDGRSLQALFKRGLINWESRDGWSPFIGLEPTEAGSQLFEEELRYR